MRRRKRTPDPTPAPAETPAYLGVWRSFAWKGRVFAQGDRVLADDPLVREICEAGSAGAFYRQPRES